MDGDGWTMLGELWDLRFGGGGALAGSVRLCGWVCVCVYQRRKKMVVLDLWWKGNLTVRVKK